MVFLLLHSLLGVVVFSSDWVAYSACGGGLYRDISFCVTSVQDKTLLNRRRLTSIQIRMLRPGWVESCEDRNPGQVSEGYGWWLLLCMSQVWYQGLSRDLSCLISLSVAWGGDTVHSHQVCRCHQLQLGEGYQLTYSRAAL